MRQNIFFATSLQSAFQPFQAGQRDVPLILELLKNLPEEACELGLVKWKHMQLSWFPSECGACEAADFFPLEQVPGSVDAGYVSMHLHICSPTFWLSTVNLCPLPTFETL